MKDSLKAARELTRPYQVVDGRKFHLKDFDPGDTGRLKKERAKEELERGIEQLTELQERLYAQDSWAVLLIFQAMDAAGKDSTIKHVMSGVNPQGCQVFSFKAPSAQELDHDFLWRTWVCLPERGRIGIFNRSYYEEVLVVRVHPEWLARQRLPKTLSTKRIWDERLADIRHFEQYLAHNGIAVLKFFLNVSRKEQKKRFLERLERPEKNWKFSVTDVEERRFWKDYMRAYEAAIAQTATEEAPWYVVPADNKWFTRLVVSAAIIERLAALGLQFPEVTQAKRKELAQARRKLLAE